MGGKKEGALCMMHKQKERSKNSMAQLQSLLARTSTNGKEPASLTLHTSPNEKVVSRKGGGFARHTSVPDFAQTRVTSVNVVSSVPRKPKTRSSFEDHVDVSNAKRLTKIGQTSQGGDLSKWLTGEMITRRQEESCKFTAGSGMSLRQLMKLDDRIDPQHIKKKRYDQQIEDEENMNVGRFHQNTRLRHVASYRATME